MILAENDGRMSSPLIEMGPVGLQGHLIVTLLA
jgi:hypothetical protein